MPLLQLVSGPVYGRGNRGGDRMARLNIDKYMTELQEAALKYIDHTRLKNENIMFRSVEVKHLVPRYRVEIGVVINGNPVLASTMREKDPRLAGIKLAAYVNDLLDTHVGV